MASQDIATLVLNSRRSLLDRITGTHYVRAANGAIYKGYKDKSGHLTMSRYAESVSRDAFERKVPELTYDGRFRR